MKIERSSLLNSFFFFSLNIVIFIVCIYGYTLETNNKISIQEDVFPNMTVAILNGNGLKGAARDLTLILRKRNFDVLSSGNYRNFQFPYTLIIDRKDNPYARGLLEKYCETKKSIVIIDKSIFDFTIILGKNRRIQ